MSDHHTLRSRTKCNESNSASIVSIRGIGETSSRRNLWIRYRCHRRRRHSNNCPAFSLAVASPPHSHFYSWKRLHANKAQPSDSHSAMSQFYRQHGIQRSDKCSMKSAIQPIRHVRTTTESPILIRILCLNWCHLIEYLGCDIDVEFTEFFQNFCLRPFVIVNRGYVRGSARRFFAINWRLICSRCLWTNDHVFRWCCRDWFGPPSILNIIDDTSSGRNCAYKWLNAL